MIEKETITHHGVQKDRTRKLSFSRWRFKPNKIPSVPRGASYDYEGLKFAKFWACPTRHSRPAPTANSWQWVECAAWIERRVTSEESYSAWFGSQRQPRNDEKRHHGNHLNVDTKILCYYLFLAMPCVVTKTHIVARTEKLYLWLWCQIVVLEWTLITIMHAVID